MDIINLNKFIWFKKNMLKKKKGSRNWKWATAHLSHDTMDCIVTLGWGGVAWAQPGGHNTARTQPRYGRACATIWPTWPATWSARAQGQAARREGLVVERLGRDTIRCIMTDARLSRWV